MENPPVFDLGALALGLAVKAVLHALVIVLGLVVVVLGLDVAGVRGSTDTLLRVAAGVGWIAWETKGILQLRRAVAAGVRLRTGTHVLHGIELCIAGFLAVYSLARPYLAEGDASAYPYVKVMFEVSLAILTLSHCIVLVLFRQKPSRKDVWTLATCFVAGLLALR